MATLKCECGYVIGKRFDDPTLITDYNSHKCLTFNGKLTLEEIKHNVELYEGMNSKQIQVVDSLCCVVENIINVIDSDNGEVEHTGLEFRKIILEDIDIYGEWNPQSP